MLKIGIIGCGKIAQYRHIPEYLANEKAKIVGYFDFNTARAQNMAEEFGGKAYDSYQALLANREIDAVSVCTTNISHAEITIAALEAGKHVLCEKPMATSMKACQDMVDTAKKQSRFLMIGHNQRLAKAHVRAKELLASGLIGEIVSFRTTFGHPGPETWSIDPGPDTWFFDQNLAVMGVMGDLGIHKTDLIHYLTGQRIVETTARLHTLNKLNKEGDPISVDDNAFCIYRLEGGAVGTMHVSWTFYGSEDNSTIIYGTKGIMRIYDEPAYAIRVNTLDDEEILFNIDRIQTNESQTKSSVIDAFVESVLENKEPEISGEAVLDSMRVIFASVESSDLRRPVIIKH
ncbi:MAG: Gfo/Idh/MocA family oxidoreductase [Chloroflexota bacterium]|nr:Gfo/Idh/MocA family oxidoreductase [Chloroflexota bacterium]